MLDVLKKELSSELRKIEKLDIDNKYKMVLIKKYYNDFLIQKQKKKKYNYSSFSSYSSFANENIVAESKQKFENGKNILNERKSYMIKDGKKISIPYEDAIKKLKSISIFK